MAHDDDRQITSHLLMVRPAHFGPNAETAPSNAFQHSESAGGDATARCARQEFDALAAALRDAGAQPVVVPDTATPVKPDAVFPNNWVSFHDDGTTILYPMEAANRRAERRPEVLVQLAGAGLVRLDRLLDLTALERHGWFLEGTGSLVIDRVAGLAYAAWSSRTHRQAIAEFTRLTGMEVLGFHAADAQGRPLYHTNVMLSVGRRFAVVCAAAVAARDERAALLDALAASGREVIDISLGQAGDFAANILEVATGHERSVIAMSDRARRALGSQVLRRLQAYADILAVPIPTIEHIGGGSVRCMLAEVFVARAGARELRPGRSPADALE